VITDTGDCEGRILETRTVPTLTIEKVQACLQTFIGTQSQTPPMYSALKVNGKKLYELAREGKIIERKARNINIYHIRLISFHLMIPSRSMLLALRAPTFVHWLKILVMR
jgi:tRNA pseudouridine55 synthase